MEIKEGYVYHIKKYKKCDTIIEQLLIEELKSENE